MPQEDLCLAVEGDRNELNELDYMLCRNVEVFSASQEDVRDNAHDSCDVVAVGQVGLQCIHCKLSPFATARHGTVFPTSIVHIEDSLCLMAEWHFPLCSMTPSNVRERIGRALPVVRVKGDKKDDDSMSLKVFCESVVAKRFKMQNLSANNSGIIFSKGNREGKPSESPQQTPFRQSNSRFRLDHVNNSAASYHHSRQHSSPLQYTMSPAQHRHMQSLPPRQTIGNVPHNATSPQPFVAPHPPIDRRLHLYQSTTPQSRLDHSYSFRRESMGWSCSQCSSIPFQFRAPNSFYPHITPPTSSFIEYHQQLCTGTRFYETTTQHSRPDPDALSPDAALEYFASSSSYDSPLVLAEDRRLLSDYFFFLIKQLQPCYFIEADRKTRGGKRDNIKVGFGGLECRHCARISPSFSRKFFWSNVDRLANSFAEIPNHILNCKNCPERMKKALHVLKVKHPEQMGKLKRGSQKVFFRRMWRRVHKDWRLYKESSTEKDETQDTSTSGTTSVSIPNLHISKISLAIPEDKDWLSDTDCFVRRNVEVFCASHDDIISAKNDFKSAITLDQVGIRCMHCSSSSEGARGTAVHFPYSIDSIYEVVKEFHKSHLESCTKLPADVSQEMSKIKTSTSLSSVSNRYYVLAAKALGMMDTSEGIRMSEKKMSMASTDYFSLESNQDVAASESTSSVKEQNEQETSRKRKASQFLKDKDCKKQNT